MPTILFIDGRRFVVYPNDHPPAHVHVVGPGWVVVVDIQVFAVREVIGACRGHEARQVLRLARENAQALWEGWRRFHG